MSTSQTILTTADLVDGLITPAKMASQAIEVAALGNIAGNGLQGGAGSALAVLPNGGTLTVTASGVSVSSAGITSTELANAAVTAGKIAAGGVSNANQFAAGVVDNAAIGAGAVDTDELAALAVTTAKIAANAVTAAKADLGAGNWFFNGGALVQVPDISGGASGFSAANKNYVDSVATGLDVKQSCVMATTGNLPPNTYSNGTAGVGATLTANANGPLSIDGIPVTATGIRILVKNEQVPAYNGIYVSTTVGDASNAYVLTRTVDFDTNKEVTPGAFTFIEQGTANADSGWVLNTDGAITIGTTNLTFSQFSGAGAITPGTALQKVGNTINVLLDGTTVSTNGSNQLQVTAGGIGASQLASDAVTTAKILAANVTYAKLAADVTSKIGRFDMREEFTASAGQTTFTLANSNISANAGGRLLSVNGLIRPSADFGISGSTLTMNFALASGDKVSVYYGIDA
jgi:hypothetical protein